MAEELEVIAVALRGPIGVLFSGLLGLLFGSFANVCIYRWPPTEDYPNGRSVWKPGSHCQHCGEPVRFYDNIPILSYLWLRGACRHCKTRFSPRYLLVEAVTGMLFVAVFYFCMFVLPAGGMGERWLRFSIYAALSFVLVVVTFIDLDHQLILDKVTVPSILLFYALGLLLPERTVWDGLIGAAVGYGVVRLISDGYYLVTKREGMGYGDGKLLALIGAFLGWKAVVVALFLGSLLGTVVCVPLLLFRRQRESGSESGTAEGEPAEMDEAVDQADFRHLAVPFGPFLAAGGFAYLFLEPWIELTWL